MKMKVGVVVEYHIHYGGLGASVSILSKHF